MSDGALFHKSPADLNGSDNRANRQIFTVIVKKMFCGIRAQQEIPVHKIISLTILP
jgi:hypothetical protein